VTQRAVRLKITFFSNLFNATIAENGVRVLRLPYDQQQQQHHLTLSRQPHANMVSFRMNLTLWIFLVEDSKLLLLM
jgi:hypothetical protein